MNRSALLLPVWAIVALVCSPLNALEIYVSPSGTDAADGSISKPFPSIEMARDAIRALPESEREQDIRVRLRGGLYPLAETVVFTRQDGARDVFSISYEAYENEVPVLSSGVPVEGWSKLGVAIPGLPEVTRGKVWVADMPEGLDDFKVLFDGDRRLERARSRGFQSPEQKFKMFATRNVASPEDRPLLRRLEFPVGEIRDWSNLEDVEAFFCGVPWTQNISSLESVDLAKRIAWLKYEGNTPPSTTPKPYNPTRIENVIDVLDTPGEWCVNTRTRKIYYWPINGQPSDKILAPRLQEFIRVEGDIDYDGPEDKPVAGLRFKGLSFTHGDRYSWWKDHKGWGIQHDWDKFDHGNALLRFRGAEDCVVEACHFTNSGNSAIRLDLHCQGISIQNNLIERVGHMGILLCGYGPGTKDVNKGNRIVNNLIERVGEVIWHGHAIFVWQSGGNYIANNMIREVPRKAIGICGVRGAIFQEGQEVDWDEASKTIRWHEITEKRFVKGEGTQEKILPYLHSRNNVVENNYVYRARTKIGDGAALNVSGAGTGNVMRRNMLYMSLGNGMRCDDWQNGTLFEQNLILAGGVVHKGKNDLVNNLFINTNIRFSLYPDQQPNPGSVVKGNIMYHTRPGIAPYTSRESDTISTPESCDVDGNLYFATTGLEEIQSHVSVWRERGNDIHSLVADPLFENPLDFSKELRPGDFKLRDDSPAYDLGFPIIDFESIGLLDTFPHRLLALVEPSLRGEWISRTAKLSWSSINERFRKDVQLLVSQDEELSLPTLFESSAEAAPFVQLDLGKESEINGLHVIAHAKDRQNALRGLTVWTSRDASEWVQVWHADPYPIAMGREWRIRPYEVLAARYVRIGLKPREQLQMSPQDERMKSIKKSLLSLKSVKVFGAP